MRKIHTLFILLYSILICKAIAFAQTNPTYFTKVILATSYDPTTSGSKEVSIPDVFTKFAMLGLSGAFNNSKWYPGPGRTYQEGGLTFNWNASTDFSQYKSNFKNFYLNTSFQVRISYRGKTVIATVKDAGPWNMQDNYWNDKANSDPAQRRRLHTEVNRGYPEATAAFFNEFEKRRDEAARTPNGAGIDISTPLAQELGFGGKDWVLVEFLWLSPEYKVGDWVQAQTGGVGIRVRSNPSLSSALLATKPDGSNGQIVSGYVVSDNYLWWKVNWGDVEGWSAGRYLEVGTPSQTPIPSGAPTGDLDSPKTDLRTGDSFVLDLVLKSAGSKSPIDFFFSIEIGGLFPTTIYLGPDLKFVPNRIPVVTNLTPIDARIRMFGPDPSIFAPSVFGELRIPPHIMGSFIFGAEIVDSSTKASISKDSLNITVNAQP